MNSKKEVMKRLAVVCNKYGLKFLEELGGINKHNYNIDNTNLVYYINNLGVIEKESKERYELYCTPMFDITSVDCYHHLLEVVKSLKESNSI